MHIKTARRRLCTEEHRGLSNDAALLHHDLLGDFAIAVTNLFHCLDDFHPFDDLAKDDVLATGRQLSSPGK